MVKLVRDAEPGDPTRDVEAICRAVAYNWLILGTDAHAKNYSLLLSGAQVRLAPLYDIASAAPYDLHRSRHTLAQKVGGEYRPSFIARRHWDRLAADCGVNPEELTGDIHTLIDRIPDVLSDTIRDASLTEDEGTAAGRLLDAISEWLTVCNRSLDSGPDATTRPLAPPATSAAVRHDNPLRLVADELAARANIGPATGTRRCVGTYSNGKRCEHRAQPWSDYCRRKHGRS